MKIRLLLILLTSIFSISSSFATDYPPNHEIEDRGPEFANCDNDKDFKKDEDFRSRRYHKRKNLADLRMLERECPELTEKIKELKKNNPAVVKEFARQLRGGDYRRIMFGLKSRDEETKKLTKDYLNNELQSLILSVKYKDQKEESVKKEITSLLYTSFEIKTKLQHKFVEQMETRIMKVKEMLDKRMEQKDKIIEQRILELTEERGAISW